MSTLQYPVNITPTLVYPSNELQTRVRHTLQNFGLTVVDFRPPKFGDVYLSKMCGVCEEHIRSWPDNEPRLIVVKRDPAPPVVGEFRVTVKDVYGVEYAELAEIADRLGAEIIGFRIPEAGERWLLWEVGRRGNPDFIRVSESGRVYASADATELDGRRYACGIRAIVRTKVRTVVDPFD